MKIKGILNDIYCSILANGFSLLVNAVTIFAIPKILNEEYFGYYQLYLFYLQYVGLLHFGICDGIYLRLGGKYYNELNRSELSTQFWTLAAFELFINLLIVSAFSKLIQDYNKILVIQLTCASAVIICCRFFVTMILQATKRVIGYATVIISDKVILLLLTLFSSVFKINSLIGFLLSYYASLFFSLCVGIVQCRDVVFCKFSSLKKCLFEIKNNISAGIKLTLTNISGLLIIGVVRFGVEHHWDIATFGKVSLTLSISNMAVTALNAIGVVIYPILRRTNQEKLPEIYKIMRIMLMGLVFGALVFYYPAQKILTLWLPQYAESLRYAAILLPICVYESKVSILINTYFNTLRLESLQMKCNLTALALSLLLTGVSIYVFDSVTAAIFSILIVLVFRCVICEIVLSTKISIKVVKDIIIELVVTLAFIICNWYLGFIGMLMYAVCYIMYIIIKRKDILESLNFIKSMR